MGQTIQRNYIDGSIRLYPKIQLARGPRNGAMVEQYHRNCNSKSKKSLKTFKRHPTTEHFILFKKMRAKARLMIKNAGNESFEE